MNGSSVTRADQSGPRKDTLFAAFEQQQQAVHLERMRANIFTDLLLLPKVNLNEAEDAAREAISRIMPGPFGQAIERQVLASFRQLAYLRSLVPEGTERLRQLVDDWHSFLDQAVTAEQSSESSPTKYFLTAFSLVEDYTIALTQAVLDELVKAIADRERMTKEEALHAARHRADLGENRCGGKLDEGIWDGIDILALIIVLMHREGLKPLVLNADLQAWVINYFSARSSKTLGGAAANETYILREIGLPVLVHTPYHHQGQTDAAPDCAKRLVFDRTGPVRPFPSLKDGNSNDARRLSFVLQLTPELDEHGQVAGPVLTVDGQVLRPKLADRVILRIPKPRVDRPVNWEKFKVTWKAHGTELNGIKPMDEDPSTPVWNAQADHWALEMDRQVLIDFLEKDWPYLPVFQHRPIVDADGTLIIELASVDELEAIADDVQAVLLGAIQMLGRTVFAKPITVLLRVALTDQLKALGSKGASLHFELSGVDSGQVLAELGKLCRTADISHISTNREELAQITSEFGSPYFVAPRPIVPESPFTIYWRAERLLSELGLDTYYVHDLELDILVRRNHPGEGPDMTAELERHRQAMLFAKAAVPEALMRRAKADEGWNLVLSTQSLAGLLAFANEYAEHIAATVKGVKEEVVLDQILRKGYYQHPDQDGASVVVAPTVFVKFGQKASMAGAGDMCFAAHATAKSWLGQVISGSGDNSRGDVRKATDYALPDAVPIA